MRNVFDATELMDQARAIAGVRTTRERRIDEAVRRTVASQGWAGLQHWGWGEINWWRERNSITIRAEYRRIVEREEWPA